jgi:hypothetical protein
VSILLALGLNYLMVDAEDPYRYQGHDYKSVKVFDEFEHGAMVVYYDTDEICNR